MSAETVAVPKFAVELRGLAKAFGSCVANRDIHLKVAAGSIHAVIGENGAGKSTAMKMLYGMYRPDAGEIFVHGERKIWRSPQDAIACGIGMVNQHFMLAETETVLDNILLGAEPRRGLFRTIDRAGARARLTEVSARYGLAVPLDARIGALSVGIQQRIEILKALYREASILILDEPTAVLTPGETTELFAQLRAMRSREGKTILIITHKLKEVLELADAATVFRGGSVTGSLPTAGATPGQLATLMVGREVRLLPPERQAVEPGAPVLEVRGLRRRGLSEKPLLENIDLTLRQGEVVGIAGVEGNGQSELLGALLRPAENLHQLSGRITLLGRETLGEDRALGAREILGLGLGAIPEDRHREALFLTLPLTQSFLLGFQGAAPFSRGGVLSERTLRAATAQAIQELDVRPPDPFAEAGSLSGGNQQKLIVARELRRMAVPGRRLLIAAQPTRGVDVGAIELIHRRILEERARGAGVLLISSELEEVLALSDRIAVMYGGRIAVVLPRADADERRLGLYMGGGSE